MQNNLQIYVRSGVGIVSYFRSGVRKMRRKVKNRESIVKIYVKSNVVNSFVRNGVVILQSYLRFGVGMVKTYMCEKALVWLRVRSGR